MERVKRPDSDLVSLAVIVCVELAAVLTGEGDGGVEGQLSSPAAAPVERRLRRWGTEDCGGAIRPGRDAVLPILPAHHRHRPVAGLHLAVVLEELAWGALVADGGEEGNVPVSPAGQHQTIGCRGRGVTSCKTYQSGNIQSIRYLGHFGARAERIKVLALPPTPTYNSG